MKYTKAIAKKMRELASQAYERELRRELEKLAEQFKSWQDEQIDTWDLENAVHKFHNGPARELYKRYTGLSPAEVLPYALFRKLITYEELPPEIDEEMRFMVDHIYTKYWTQEEPIHETE